MTTNTETTHAIVTAQAGSVTIADLAPQPLGPGDVRIRVAAASINPVDDFLVSGLAQEAGWTEQGSVVGLGWDAAGVIVDTGADVRDPELTVGARVVGIAANPAKTVGGQSTELVVDARHVAAIPDDLTFVEAATFPLNSLTADQALDALGDANGTLLVTGAAGGVGGYAVPLAHERGWDVTGLGRSGDLDYIASVGGKPIDQIPTGTRYDAVLDAANLGAEITPVVRHGGAIARLIVGDLPADDLEVHSIMVQPNVTRLRTLLGEAVAGRLPIRVRATYPLDDVEDAYRDFRAGGRGRVVIVTDLAS